MIGLIWAQAANGVIGADGAVPWHLPEDLASFRNRTLGATVLMGRATWDSIPQRYRPLPGRTNLVLSRDADWSGDGATWVATLDDAVATASGDLWVIGGATVYTLAQPIADRAVVTELADAFEGDTFAPALDLGWQVADRDPLEGWHRSAEGLRFRIIDYRRAIP